MKKITCFVAIALIMTFSSVSKAGGLADFGKGLAMYPVNRAFDLLDIFSISVGVGPTLRVEGRATRLITAGAGAGSVAKLIKGINRQYGYGVQNGWDANLFFVSVEDLEMTNVSKPPFFVKPIEPIDHIVIYAPSDRIYDFYKGARDYWGIGATVGAVIVEVSVDVHLVEIADFITGIFCIDLKADDIEWDSFEEYQVEPVR